VYENGDESRRYEKGLQLYNEMISIYDHIYKVQLNNKEKVNNNHNNIHINDHFSNNCDNYFDD
jgi:hypothetical protein